MELGIKSKYKLLATLNLAIGAVATAGEVTFNEGVYIEYIYIYIEYISIYILYIYIYLYILLTHRVLTLFNVHYIHFILKQIANFY